ncbi:MAG: rhomboid family intramembrane serine protease, partial [Acidobacteria bacterium]|nr:rhomboid family intramembrane serine protease [Acidobacteriota bacterium]
LWIYGDNVEDILGHFKYLLFYLLCGVAAALLHIILNPDLRVPTIGASGAIAGVMGAYLLKFRHAKVQVLVFYFFFTFVEIPAAFLLIYWFVVQLFSGLGSIAYSQVSEGGVAVWAHIGGFLAGMILIKLFRTREPYARRRQLNW